MYFESGTVCPNFLRVFTRGWRRSGALSVACCATSMGFQLSSFQACLWEFKGGRIRNQANHSFATLPDL